MRLGFVGTGTITAAMVRGLKSSALAGTEIILSPRGATLAAQLATLPGVSIAADNQAVVDQSDMVVLAIRPQVAPEVIRPLRFRDGQQVLSLVAGLQIATMQEWIAADVQITRAVPLPFVEDHEGVTPIHPANPVVAPIFDALGQCIPLDSLADYDSFAAASALMASYFGIIGHGVDWMTRQGIAGADANAYLRAVFFSLGKVMAAAPQMSLDDLRHAHATKGGLNEMVFDRFVQNGGTTAIDTALDAVLARIRG